MSQYPTAIPESELAASTRAAGFTLEKRQRLSDSIIWNLQRNFFNQQGIRAWSQGTVPHYITDNSFIAGAYAKVVLGFLRDCRSVNIGDGTPDCPPLDPGQPVYIVELGCGSGRFAFHVLKRLGNVFSSSSPGGAPLKYIMTDFVERNVDYWSAHASLRPLVERGVLDFARFDAEYDQELELIHSGITLSRGTVSNPIVIIANYFFDSIPQDAFCIEDGRLYQKLLTITSREQEPDLGDPGLLNRIEVAYEQAPAPADYYDDEDLNQILRDYRQRLPSTALLFPHIALGCIKRLRALSRGRLLLISSDKGYIREDALIGRQGPELALHGSFSLMVNYHAIAQYFLNCGGQTLRTSHRHAHINVCGFLLGDHPHRYAETRQAYSEAVEQGGPDEFYSLKRGIEKHYDGLSLEELMAWLRLSGWDSRIFLDSFPALLDLIESASGPMREELCQAIQQVWDNYYHIGEERDVAFSMAMLLYGMQYYPEAIDYFHRSLDLYGPEASTFYNMAMCRYSLRQLDTALENINQTLLLDPSFEAAKAMRIRLQSEIDNRAL
jgi:tetratricopeptide (TPR) repeat protein